MQIFVTFSYSRRRGGADWAWLTNYRPDPCAWQTKSNPLLLRQPQQANAIGGNGKMLRHGFIRDMQKTL